MDKRTVPFAGESEDMTVGQAAQDGVRLTALVPSEL